MEQDKAYWFEKKRHSVGFGRPVTWQGWAVIFVYAILVLAPLFLLPVLETHWGEVSFTNFVFWTILLFLIVIKKRRIVHKSNVVSEEYDEYWFSMMEQGKISPISWQGWLIFFTFPLLALMPVFFKSFFGDFLIVVEVPNVLVWLVFLFVIVWNKSEKE
jgi:hypothetical protein